MRNGHFLFSAIQFLMIVVLFSVGGIFLALYFQPQFSENLAVWILKPNAHFLVLGALTLGLALLLFIVFSMMHRDQFLRIKMKKSHFFIDESLVRSAILRFWDEEFPEREKPQDIYFAREKIEVITQLPKSENIEQTLSEIEERLGNMLSDQFGYQKQFFVSVRRKN